ncbi:hypothetical protein LSH36_735g01042 [Paralvinella palmiformis]|uniref:Uncharacterized protein n=1 Tax=Paralvinella palmiformis TaxID=53620 RepID=A0AAD9J263_9ANNE|nr:hypothetical protein LSH36_735g01042 [Paralvinella palmiformis]
MIRAQFGADSEDTHPRWVSDLLFGETDDSGEEFEGFHSEWMTDPRHFRPVNVPDFALNGSSTYQHPEETTAAYYFGLIWDDQMWDRLTVKSNRYALSKGRASTSTICSKVD